MRRVLLLSLSVLAACLVVAPVQGQERVPGVVHFSDGSTQEFVDVVSFWAYEPDEGTARDGVNVDYQNSVRTVPFDRLREFTVEDFVIEDPSHRSSGLADATATIRTTTGEETRTVYAFIRDLRVLLLDELTGEKTDQTLKFVRDGELNIRSITFDP